MTIDPRTGAVTMRNGWRCEPTQNRVSVLDADRIVLTPLREVASYASYRVHAMESSAADLELVLSFEGQRLTRVEFDECSSPPEAAPTTESEARRMIRFLAVLEASLGKPHKTKRVPSSEPSDKLLSRYLTWTFGWGDAWCGAHPKDGTVSAGLGYKQS